MDNDRRFNVFNESEDGGAITYVEFVVLKAGEFRKQAFLIPTGITLGTKEDGTLIIIYSVDGVAEFAGEIGADFRANESGRASDKEGFGHSEGRRDLKYET